MSELVLVLAAAAVVSAFLAYRYYRDVGELRVRCSQLAQQSSQASTEARELHIRYAGISDMEAAIAAAKAKLDQTKRDQQQFESESERQRSELTKEYAGALAKYEDLKKEVSLLEENLDDMLRIPRQADHDSGVIPITVPK